MSRPRAISLCSGYGGLDMAADAALGPAELVAVADIDPGAKTFLNHRHPDVPNLGDITGIDWTRLALGAIDRLDAGYPCQPMSLAGRRAGTQDERWLWDDGVFPAIRDLRPGSVVLENVPGHLSVGFGRVLGDLASIGYDASWVCVRASDVGAPHRRERVFIVAEPADTARDGHGHAGPQGFGRVPATTVASGARTDGVTLLATPAARDVKGPDARRRVRGDGSIRSAAQDSLPRQILSLLPTPTATPYGNNQSQSAGTVVRPSLDSLAHVDRWGEYGAAIARWETVTGRPAPDPTEPGKNGRRLAARFVEFLMGLPDGWVCDVPGLTRNQQLHLLGNGVVWHQGAYGIALATQQLHRLDAAA